MRGPHLRSAIPEAGVKCQQEHRTSPSRTTHYGKKKLICFAQGEKKLYRFRIPASRLDWILHVWFFKNRGTGRGILYAYDALASIFTSRIEDRRYDVVISFTCFSLLSALSASALFGCCCCLLFALRPTSGIGIVCNMHKCALRRVGFRPRGV